MCLYITLTPPEGAKLSQVKRVLKGASALDPRPVGGSRQNAFYLHSDGMCSCGLLEATAHVSAGEIELKENGRRAVEHVADAMVQASLVPFDIHFFWADAQVREVVNVNICQFRKLVQIGRFDSRTVLRVSNRGWHAA
jgi:hypothetical protein